MKDNEKKKDTVAILRDLLEIFKDNGWMLQYIDCAIHDVLTAREMARTGQRYAVSRFDCALDDVDYLCRWTNPFKEFDDAVQAFYSAWEEELGQF